MIVTLKKNIKKSILFIFFLVFVFYSFYEPLYTPTAIPVKSKHYIFPEIIAHKSLVSNNFIGNSLSAVKEAIASTVDGIEVDVRISKDGVLFLYHGDSLEEYTNFSGIPENYTWDELSNIQYKNSTQNLISLDHFLNLVGTKKVIFLDLKSNNVFDLRMIKAVSEIIKKHNLKENVFVESFNPMTMFLMRLYSRDIMIMYDFIDNAQALGEEKQNQFDKIPWILKQYWIQKQIRRIIRPDVLGPRFNFNSTVLKDLIKNGYPLICWTVDSPDIAKTLYSYGVKGLQTNRSEIIEKILPKTNKKISDAGGNEVIVDEIISVFDYNDVLKAIKKAKQCGKKISIGGCRQSMGGQSLLDQSIFLNMMTLNQVTYDEKRKTVTAQAGATWKKVQEILSKYARSVKVMQSDNIFTVGGSVSANVHGWQISSPPIGSTVLSMTVVTTDEKIRKISLDKEPELFKAIIGGYGVFAIILDVELITVPNSLVKFHTLFTKINFLKNEFSQNITGRKNIELFYSRLSVDKNRLFEEAGLFWYANNHDDRNLEVSIIESKEIEPENLIALKRSIFRFSEYTDLGKKIRWQAEKLYAFWRNKKSYMRRSDAMNTDIHILWSLYGQSVDVLHEYFVPKDKIVLFLEVLKKQIQKYDMNILNVTIREVRKDIVSLLPYAKQDVFGFVCLFSQDNKVDSDKKMKEFTRSLIGEVLELDGTFYLPYSLDYTSDQLIRSYPNIKEWMLLKKKYDPELILSNKFFQYIDDLFKI
jgi:FAD/FMN-containing dehydrogenase/glycerophosphoryl diester phosphodiesterase